MQEVNDREVKEMLYECIYIQSNAHQNQYWMTDNTAELLAQDVSDWLHKMPDNTEWVEYVWDKVWDYVAYVNDELCPPLQIGDIVICKNMPIMRITGFIVKRNPEDTQMIRCTWSDEGNEQSAIFARDELTKLNNSGIGEPSCS